MRFALIALLVPTFALADDMTMRSEFDSMPTTNCTVSVFTPPAEGTAWTKISGPTNYTQGRNQSYGTRNADGSSEGELLAIDDYASLQMGLRRNARRDWVSSVRPVLASGTQVYLTPVPAEGRCGFRGGRVLRGGEVASQAGISMPDDRAEARSEKRCLKIEKRSDGSAIGMEISCTQAHNPIRDAERRDEAAAGAGGGRSGSGSGGSKRAN